jgi:hypothetical protein
MTRAVVVRIGTAGWSIPWASAPRVNGEAQLRRYDVTSPNTTGY